VAKKDEVEAKEQEPKDLNGSKDSKEANKPTTSGSNRVSNFLQGSKEELDKVVWPGRQQLISESIAVVLMVTLSATLIYLVDNLFRWAATQVF